MLLPAPLPTLLAHLAANPAHTPTAPTVRPRGGTVAANRNKAGRTYAHRVHARLAPMLLLLVELALMAAEDLHQCYHRCLLAFMRWQRTCSNAPRMQLSAASHALRAATHIRPATADCHPRPLLLRQQSRHPRLKVLEANGSQGGGLTTVFRHFSWAPHRWNSVEAPARHQCCMQVAIAILLACSLARISLIGCLRFAHTCVLR